MSKRKTFDWYHFQVNINFNIKFGLWDFSLSYLKYLLILVILNFILFINGRNSLTQRL
jgi:hypothetical protein